MNRKERLAHLIKAIKMEAVNVDNLSEQFGVSASTIRRDLQFLQQHGHIQRTYGGAVLNHAAPEMSYVERMEHYGANKQAIAAIANELIRDGDTIMLDAGSSICALGHLLVERKLHIITNNLMLVPILEGAPHLDLIILGGKCRNTSMSIFGALALKNLEHLTADIFFTSADGVVAGRGLCEASLDQIVLKDAMMRRAAKTVVLADSHKINRAEQHCWADFPAHWTLISDSGMSQKDKSRFEEQNVKVMLANVPKNDGDSHY